MKGNQAASHRNIIWTRGCDFLEFVSSLYNRPFWQLNSAWGERFVLANGGHRLVNGCHEASTLVSTWLKHCHCCHRHEQDGTPENLTKSIAFCNIISNATLGRCAAAHRWRCVRPDRCQSLGVKLFISGDGNMSRRPRKKHPRLGIKSWKDHPRLG